MEIYIKDIVRECNGKLVLGNENIVCKNFSKDTRTLVGGDIYVGIKGENFDGNLLYLDALDKGASACVIQGIDEDEIRKNCEKYNDCAVVIVEDTITALQKIASYKRRLYNIPVVAITGSVGKTSTKDIVASVVGTKYKTLKTQGNLNNHIGLPLTLLGLDEHEAVVVEMGMNNLGEISTLSKIAEPTVAVITNVGTSHIGNLGSRENIRKAKLEILDGLISGGTLIINNDNDMLHSWYEEQKNKSNDFKIVTYGINSESDFMAKNVKLGSSNSVFKVNDNELVEVPVGGEHFVYNAICAVAVGKTLDINLTDISSGIKNFELSKNRMEILKLRDGIVLINDCYNANYDSMSAGIQYLAKSTNDRKIAVLGDMLELGEFSDDLHRKVANVLQENKIDILVTVGEKAKIINDNFDGEKYVCGNNDEAVETLKNLVKKNDRILVKASNGMKFKEIVENLKKVLTNI